MGDAFDAAAERLARGETSQALVELVAHWRVTRSPHTAAIIERLGVTDELQQKLSAVVTPRVATSATNFEALRDIDDPRLSRYALNALANPPFCAPSAQSFLLALADTIARLRDGRLHAELPHIKSVLRARLARKPMFVELARRLDEIAAALPAAVEPTPAEAKVLATLKPARTAEELLAAVYANPDDDVPRQIYADFLLERGDPRGEFIALQLQRARDAAPSARETELLAKYGKQWLGPLAIVLRWGKSYSNTKFERGFVSVADFIDHAEKKLRLIAADPGWATIEELARGNWPDEFITAAPLRALKHFATPLDGDSGAVLLQRSDPLRAVASATIRGPDADLARFRRVLPSLRSVTSWNANPTATDMLRFAQIDIQRVELRSWYRDHDAIKAAIQEFEAHAQALEGAYARVEELVLFGPFAPAQPDAAPSISFRRDASGKLRRATS